MKYRGMMEAERELAKPVDAWMDQAKRTDEQEDRKHGPDRRGGENPAHIKEKMRKLVKVLAARTRLSREAAEKVEGLRREREEKAEREGRELSGREPKALERKPEDKAQSNFNRVPSSALPQTLKMPPIRLRTHPKLGGDPRLLENLPN